MSFFPLIKFGRKCVDNQKYQKDTIHFIGQHCELYCVVRNTQKFVSFSDMFKCINSRDILLEATNQAINSLKKFGNYAIDAAKFGVRMFSFTYDAELKRYVDNENLIC